jgi:hypothetical protein
MVEYTTRLGPAPIRITIATLLMGAALAIGPTPIATAHTHRGYVAASERTGEWARDYDRCMRRCPQCQRRPPPPVSESYVRDDYPPQWRVRPKSRSSDLTVAFLGIGFFAFVLFVIGRAIRRHALRVSMKRMRRAEAHLERRRAEVFRRTDEL